MKPLLFLGNLRIVWRSLLAIACLSLVARPAMLATAQTPPSWYNCRTRERFTPAKRLWCSRWQTLQTITLVVPTTLDSNAELTTVTLTNGRYQRADGRFFVELVNERNWFTFGDLNEDGKQDAAVIFGVALDPDGRAVATYLTAVMDIDGAAQAITPIRLGERIRLNGPITIADQQVKVPLLTMTEVIDRAYQLETRLIQVR